MHKFGNLPKYIFIILVICLCQIFFSNCALAKSKHQNTPYQEYLFQQKVLRRLEKEKYAQSLLPPSGFMTKEDYENLSQDIPTSSMKIPDPKLPKDIKMKYIPQPTYKLTRYNSPPGTADLRIERRFKFDRQLNGQGITSPDKSMMVYPAVYYYANSQCVSSDLFVLPLDTSLPDVERILRANIVSRDPKPILSTDKNISEKYTFRTMTPIDFSEDSKLLVAKEKIGYSYDGIWKTNLWVYDFETKTSRNLVEIREAIKFYWLNTKGERLDDKRWDIYPLGFDLNNPSRIIVSAYGFTGGVPKFLGLWSIDYKGEQTLLISLFKEDADVSINGFKLVKDGVINPAEVYADEKKLDKTIKKNRAKAKKAKAKAKKEGKKVLNTKLKEMKKDVNIVKKTYKQQQKGSKPTGLD